MRVSVDLVCPPVYIYICVYVCVGVGVVTEWHEWQCIVHTLPLPHQSSELSECIIQTLTVLQSNCGQWVCHPHIGRAATRQWIASSKSEVSQALMTGSTIRGSSWRPLAITDVLFWLVTPWVFAIGDGAVLVWRTKNIANWRQKAKEGININ